MKKFLSMILCICLVTSLFVGLSVSAGNTDDGSLILNMGDVPILGKSYTHQYNAWASPEAEYDVEFSQSVDCAGVGFKGGVVMDCEVPTGAQPSKRYYNMYLKPNATINADNNMFMIYAEMPSYVSSVLPSNRQWNELVRCNSISIKQGNKEFSSNMENMTIRYLSNDANSWKSSVLVGTGEDAALTAELSGFKGYIMFDISTATNYSTWSQSGFDANADYTVTQIKLANSAIGGECGPFKVGGYYGIDTYKEDAITAQIKGVPTTHTLSNYDSNPLVVTTTDMPEAFKNGGKGTDSLGRTAGWGVGYRDETTFTTTLNTVKGKFGYDVTYSAETAHGYMSGSTNPSYTANIKTTFAKENAVGALVYIELPETGMGYSSMRIGDVVYDAYELANTFKGKQNGYAYLENDGSAWVKGNVETSGEVKLPDGFKGFVKLYFDAPKNSSSNGWYIDYSWGLFGGDYGDVVFGGAWSITKDTDSLCLKIDSKEAIRMSDAKEVLPIAGTMKDPINSEKIGSTADRVEIRSTATTITATFSANSEQIGTHAMRKVSSSTAVGEALGTSVTINSTAWSIIDPNVNTVMIWMEIPKSKVGTTWQIKIDGPNFTQNDQWYWSNPKGLQYTYLSVDSDQWMYGVIPTDGSNIMSLPDGFKGYVKFDFSTLKESYRNAWSDPNNGTYGSRPFDYRKEYVLQNMEFKLNTLGGEYGDFVLGPWTSLSHDSNSLYAVISNSGTLVNGEPEPLTRLANPEYIQLEEFRNILAEIGDVDVTDYSLIEKAIELFESFSDKNKGQLTQEEITDYTTKVNAYEQYRPSFKGVAAYVPNGDDIAGFRVGSVVDASNGVAEGYTVTEYGTVMLSTEYFNVKREKFDASLTGAVVNSFTNQNSTVTTFDWAMDYTSSNWSEYEDDFYFRAYVVYSNGDQSVTVWNGIVENRASMSKGEYEASNTELATLGNLFIKEVEFEAPYYVTCITQVANLFEFSVLSGHEYGNLNGDYSLENKSIIDEADLGILRTYLVGSNSPKNWYMSDLNRDEAVDVIDLVRFKKYLNDSDNVVIGDKSYAELLNFESGLDMYGQKSINIIGDSISQGLNAGNLYDNSWASLLKNAFNERVGANNIGFVSFNDGYADLPSESDAENYKEIHKLSAEEAQWSISKFWTKTPGLYLYTANNVDTDSRLNIALNRKEGGIDRHINGFYVYHTAGAGYGSFKVLVNDQKVATVDCNASATNNCARSPYIAIPEGCGDEIVIKIVKPQSVTGTVQIAGISYIDVEDAPTVNNYSLSGSRLIDYSDDLLKQLAKANVVVLTLGTNDLGTDQDGVNLENFRKKLDVVVRTCKENGSKLVVGNVIWDVDKKPNASLYKAALKEAAKAANGYYIDFTEIPVNKLLIIGTDNYHPTVAGHKLMANKIINFFGLN